MTLLLLPEASLARLQSCYRYFLSGGLNGRGKGVFPDDAKKFLHSVVVFRIVVKGLLRFQSKYLIFVLPVFGSIHLLVLLQNPLSVVGRSLFLLM